MQRVNNMTKSHEEFVRYSVEKSVEVDGVDFPPGMYIGKRVKLGISHQGQVQWQPWEYKIDQEQFGDLDCTSHVASGGIKIIHSVDVK